MKEELEDYIESQVVTGGFQSREHFLEAAVALYQELEVHDALRREVESRLADAAAGRVGPLDIDALKTALPDISL
jgi:Arc/MetJ-type ribon-helix-helix transcriptional regulator